MLNPSSIVNKVQSQFPEFYSEYGPSFIDFMKVYYQWMESKEYTGPTKNLPSLLDIDSTKDEFLKFFRKEYMNGLPSEILGNQRYLQKHILDLYRAKGTDEGLKLLFRLLYNKEIDIYIPGMDVFKLSSGKWHTRKYMEVSECSEVFNFEGKEVTGEVSGAKAVIESYDRVISNGAKRHILYVSSVRGTFIINERIYTDFDNISASPKILGSPVGFDIESSSPDFALGDTLTYGNTGLTFSVSELDRASLRGIITPKLIRVGNGYREGHITISYEKRDANNPGVGFELGYYLEPTGTYFWMTDESIAPYANTDLSSADFNMPGPGVEDIESPLEESLQFSSDELQNLYMVYANPTGYGYDGTVDVYVTDSDVAEIGILADDGQSYLGNNAIIEGYASFGENHASEVKIVNSSFGFNKPEYITLEAGEKKIIGTLVMGAIGVSDGRYIGTDGFLSNNKYLHDSNYYQEYSYDIKIDEVFDNYFSILKKTVHPAGKKAFGNIRIISSISTPSSIESILETN